MKGLGEWWAGGRASSKVVLQPRATQQVTCRWITPRPPDHLPASSRRWQPNQLPAPAHPTQLLLRCLWHRAGGQPGHRLHCQVRVRAGHGPRSRTGCRLRRLLGPRSLTCRPARAVPTHPRACLQLGQPVQRGCAHQAGAHGCVVPGHDLDPGALLASSGPARRWAAGWCWGGGGGGGGGGHGGTGLTSSHVPVWAR